MARRDGKDRGLFERPKGSGDWWVRYHDQFGRERREKVGTKAAAREVYQKRKNEIREGRFFPQDVGNRRKATLEEAIREYLGLNSHKRNHGHHIRYARTWQAQFPSRTLEEITSGEIERYQRRRLQQVKPASVNRELAFLKAVYNLAIRDGRVEVNPVAKVRQLKENNARVRFLSEEEEKRLASVLDAEQFALVEFAILTGLRRSEQFGLRWEDVDLRNSVLTIPVSKNGERRHVQLSQRVLGILRGLPSRMRSEWVFPSRKGTTPLEANNFYHRVFTPALKEAGIKNFVWHDLRHTFGSRLAMAGVDLRSIQELMGHKSIQMTLRYSHLSKSHLKRAVDLIGGLDSREPASHEEAAS